MEPSSATAASTGLLIWAGATVIVAQTPIVPDGDLKQILQVAAQLGVGGLLAALVFIIAWKTVTKILNETRDDKKILIDLVGAIRVELAENRAVIAANTTSNTRIEKAVEASTKAVSELRNDIYRRRERN